MISHFRSKRMPIIFGVFVLAFAAQASVPGDEIVWRPVTPEELQMKTPKVEPDADAEAIFWEVRLDDKKLSRMSYSHYVRVKIFTERGRERFSKMDIPFMEGKKVENVAARVIKPDGSVVELKPEDIFEREIAKAGKARVQAKSFAVPGIEPGVIVEYQYTETIKGDSASGERLVFQRDIPLQKVSYYVRPYADSTLAFNTYNMPETRFVDDKKGFSVGTMTNVPAFKEEPYMPPDDEVKKWVYLSYRNLGTFFQWSTVSYAWGEALKKMSKPNKEVKAKAAELTAGASSDEEKVRRIYDFVQKEIKNISFDTSITEEQVEKMDVKDADDALKRRMGSSMHVELLFASLARAAGFEVNLVLSGNRKDNFFDPEKYPFARFLHPACIAVKIGENWRFFNPGTPFLPFERLVWYEENTQSMLIGDGGFIWKVTPLSDYAKSPAKRTGRFALQPDGTLEGTVKLEYDGHQAISRRRDEFRDSQSKREGNIKNQIKSRLSNAETSELIIQNFDDNSKPLTYSFKVRVPNYAQKAGKRLIVQPGFFEYGSAPVFSSATRTYNVFFPYPWSETDDIQIKLPAGFALDNADAPQETADPQKIGSLKITMSIDTASNTLIYKRNFHFGGGGKTLFPVSVYPALKNLFDSFHQADAHALAIKQTGN
jgi:hypothetical protein